MELRIPRAGDDESAVAVTESVVPSSALRAHDGTTWVLSWPGSIQWQLWPRPPAWAPALRQPPRLAPELFGDGC
jgi:hypothetical protein